MWFTSDNAAPAHPAVMAAVVAANTGFAPGYGEEPAMSALTRSIRELFEAPEAEVQLVATGTAANALALACLCLPWGAVYCHREAHVVVSECGAPEFYTGGARLTLVDGENGRMTPDALVAAIAAAEPGVHAHQPGALSLTNVTEAGTVYGLGALAELTAVARDAGLPVHLDGARFANAVATLGCTPAEASWKAGVDLLAFGGTKNGLLGVEALVIFDPAAAPGRGWELELRRKRGGHLFSKHRYLTAQMQAALKDGLWLDLAGAANARAAALATGLAALPGVRLLHPVEANMIFAAWPEAGHRALAAAGARYYPMPLPAGGAPGTSAARLVASWCTTDAEVEEFLAVLGGALA